ncbi:MAG: D-glycero-alpha-D-manno-heptose-1,7-bisphosphate 7-phosphatase [Bacteroidia bacterium]
MNSIPAFDHTWTLFLDRDGVINQRVHGDYVRDWSGFHFAPGVLEALRRCATRFGIIVVVSNQQGVGKGYMRSEAVDLLHRQMLEAVAAAGGRIDRVYFCPDLASQPGNCRKPAPTMALQARADFPAIDFGRSVMVGDTASDMQFGRHLGMTTVWINTEEAPPDPALIDIEAQSLWHFVLMIPPA